MTKFEATPIPATVQEYVREDYTDADEHIITVSPINHIFTDDTFDIVAKLEEEQGCPLAMH